MKCSQLSATAFCHKPLVVALSLLYSNASLSQAQGLEEIIVTSQKRVQSLQDVPASVAAVDGVTIEKMGVENIEDLTQLVPNIHLTETGLSTQLRIRGIGSDNSQGFEQSVGVYKDGIYHGRAQLFRAPMFDLERAEVLRGPQGTLFGKNSIAGAVDMISAKPTDTPEAAVTASYEMEFGTKELSGYASGPLNEELRGRLAFRVYDDPGYMVNTYKQRDEAQQDEKAIRATLDWRPSENFSALLIVERDTFDVDGRFVEMTLDEVATRPSGAAGSRYSDSLAYLSSLGLGTVTFDPALNYERQSDSPEFSRNEIDSQTLRLDYDTAAFTITAITGLLEFDYNENCDCDYTPTNFFNLDLSENYEQFSQEIRLVSDEDGPVTWLAGLYYQSFEQTFHDTFKVPEDSLLIPVVQSAIPTFPSTFAGTGIDRQFEQNSDVYAVFAEATWHVTDDLRVTFGGRFTSEEKDAHKVLNMIDLSQDNAPFSDPLLAGVYLDLFNTETEQDAYHFDETGNLVVDNNGVPIAFPVGHNLNGKRSEDKFTPSINIAFDINDDTMMYGKVSKGYKSGGFDPRSNVKSRPSTEPQPDGVEPPQVSAFEFEEEQVTAYELGSKMRFANDKLEINAALFRMDYDDLQISQFDGSVGFNVGNAKKTIVQGIELDGRWQLNNHFSGSFGYAYLDFEYDDFKNGNCYIGQPANEDTGYCDYTGKRGVYTPKNTLNMSFVYERELSSTLDFTGTLDGQWVDKQQVHVNLDPQGEIDAYTLLSLRMAISSNNWELALLGKNLLDEEIITYSGDAPMSNTFFGSRTFYSFVQRPRTVNLEATLRF